MRNTWKVNIDNKEYNVIYKEKKIFVNGDPVGTFQLKKSNLVEAVYEVPLGDTVAYFYLPASDKISPVLTIDGIDVISKEPYEISKVPGWGWIYVALYGVNLIISHNIFTIIVWFTFAYGSCCMAADRRNSTKSKVIMCFGLYAIVSILIFGMAFIFSQIIVQPAA